MNEKIRQLAYRMYRKSRPDGWTNEFSQEQLEKEIDKQYFSNHGVHIDFKTPNTFNEKVQWLKAHDYSNPKKTEYADKLQVRKMIEHEVGNDVLPQVYRIWTYANDIDFRGLPDAFMLKANHGSGMYMLVRNSQTSNLIKIRKTCNQWLNRNFAETSFEMHYAPIPHKVYAEEYIDDIDWEYQAWCFAGKAAFIAAIHEPHGVNDKQFFSRDWNRLPFVSSKPIYDGDIAKPEYLDRILKCSERLSRDFPLLRMDWYSSASKGLLFSEMTFTPASGNLGWYPAEFNERLSCLITLPMEKYMDA